MTKCLAVKTAENTLEPTAQANSVATALKLAVLEKLAMQYFAPNDEIWITESGDWEVPYDGVYEILTINGGEGGYASTSNDYVYSGSSGSLRNGLVSLIKGQVISITIGAGGNGVKGPPGSYDNRAGGVTKFGNFSLKYIAPFIGGLQYRNISNGHPISQVGGGRGSAGFSAIDILPSGKWYGAGGGCYIYNNTYSGVGNGYQGAVRLRFFNPEKASLPTINDTDMIPYVNLLQRLEAIEAQLNINS